MAMDYEKIENYIQNGLPAAEKAAFEQEMAGNSALAAQVELYRQVDAQMRGAATAEAGAPALQQQLETLNRQYFGQPAKAAAVVAMRKRRWYYVAGAAAAAVLLFVVLRPWVTNSASTDGLYEEYAHYTMATVTDRGSGTDDQRAKAVALFNGKQYVQALPLLNGLAATDTSSGLALALAACHTQTGDSALAINKLLQVEARWQPGAAAHGQALWYKALLLLKYKDVAGCRKALMAIPAHSNFGDGAADLLKKLPK
jgi:hypothetical protein